MKTDGERRKEMREALDAALFGVSGEVASELVVDAVRRLLYLCPAEYDEATKWLREHE